MHTLLGIFRYFLAMHHLNDKIKVPIDLWWANLLHKSSKTKATKDGIFKMIPWVLYFLIFVIFNDSLSFIFSPFLKKVAPLCKWPYLIWFMSWQISLVFEVLQEIFPIWHWNVKIVSSHAMHLSFSKLVVFSKTWFLTVRLTHSQDRGK